MKTYIPTIKMVSLFSLFLLACVGCNNDMDEKSNIINPDPSGEPITIKAEVAGIDNFEQPTTRSSEEKVRTFVQPLDRNYDTGYDVETTVEPVKSIQTRAGSETLKGMSFRMMAYSGTSISAYTYVGQGDFRTNDTGVAEPVDGRELEIPSGDYTFVCYSYMDDKEIPAHDPALPFIEVNRGEDFITYKSSLVNVKSDSTGVFTLKGIKFSRQCIKLQVKITASGFDLDTIMACKATLSNLNGPTTNWTLGDLTLSQRGTGGSLDFEWNYPNSSSVISEKKLDLPLDKRNLILTLKEMTIGDYVLKNVVVNIEDQEFLPANDYLLTVKISQNYIQVGNYKWAKGNLYKIGNEYKFEANQEDYHKGLEGGGYFGWNTLDFHLPAHNAGAYSIETDPCNYVEPKGTWVTPSEAATKELNTGYELVEGKGAWFGPAGRKRVFLPATGYRETSPDGTKTELLGEGVAAYYQLSEEGSRLNYCNTFFFYNESANWLNAMLKINGFPIRCVKK